MFWWMRLRPWDLSLHIPCILCEVYTYTHLSVSTSIMKKSRTVLYGLFWQTFKVETVQNQFFQDCNTALQRRNGNKPVLSRPSQQSQSRNWLKISSFKTTTHSRKQKLFKISSFKTITHSQSVNCSKSVLSWQLQPPKVETVQNQFFQDHHTVPKWITIQNQFFQDCTTASQSRNW